jgi:DNA-binding PadR family transcriptional regulator
LVHYILRRISRKPCHGYEILQDIDNLTDGAWRPGAGSVYPVLRRLLEAGYIRSGDEPGAERKVYSITDTGLAALKEDEETFHNSGQKWMAMRRLFIELMEPDQLMRFLRDGTRGQFETAQEIFRTRMKDVPQKDVEYLLREYILSLEQQQEWANKMLNDLRPTVDVGRRRS